jgi:ribosomal protein S6
MQNNSHDEVSNVAVEEMIEDSAGKVKFYEVGYVLLSSIATEKVAEHVTVITDVVTKAGAKIVAHGEPELTPLAYVMTKKIHGANHRFDEGYFGWVKFELAAGAIAHVKKALDADESILRYLLMTTVKENTYLGKRAPVYMLGVAGREAGMITPEVASQTPTAVSSTPASLAQSPAETPVASVELSVTSPIAAASIADMDKSIDAMVKEA